MKTETLSTQCCIAGGGPAGMMLGFLLARAGVDVIVLEKHADFLRDFRGDTVHPSTLQVLSELGILDDFLARPHQKVTRLTGMVGDVPVTVADFSSLPCPYLVFMPQWDFLNFIAEKAGGYSGFHLRMQADVTELLQQNGQVTGVKAQTPEGPLFITSALVIGADGRHSTVRGQAGLAIKDLGSPMDVLWMRISRMENDPNDTFGNFAAGRIFVMINRQDYWQCAYVIPKGTAVDIKRKGIETLRDDIAKIVPFLAGRTQELKSWTDVKLLTVSVDRLEQWARPGLLCIGDAAHAMSPIGGVGINLAVQDAVAAANLLAAPLREGRLSMDDLNAVQKRRSWPTHMTQSLQIFLQNNVIRRVLASEKPFALPFPLKLLKRFPPLRKIPARVIGVGFRPEHIPKAG